jgi:hypothetical protein
MVQKMVHHLIISGELTGEQLVDLTDSELVGLMRFSKNAMVTKLYKNLRTRNLFREAIVVRPENFEYSEGRTGKSVTVFGATNQQIKKLVTSRALRTENQVGLEAAEQEIAEIAGIPTDDILITPISSTDRFEPKDITIYDGPHRKLASLKARYPAHFKNIEEVAQSYLAFRVCTTEKYRARLSEPKIAKKVFELVLGK